MKNDDTDNEEIFFADDGFLCDVVTDKQVGIGYASPEEPDRLWRFCCVDF